VIGRGVLVKQRIISTGDPQYGNFGSTPDDEKRKKPHVVRSTTGTEGTG